MTRKGFPSDTNGKDCACQYSRCKSHGFNSWVWKIPGEGNGNPLQYFCLGNLMDRGAWQASVRGVAKELDMTELLTNNNA